MNAFQEIDDGEQRQIDLLVDGELNESERRALLARLDRHPGAWRRCALAFLEAQSWHREMPAACDASASIAAAAVARSGSAPTVAPAEASQARSMQIAASRKAAAGRWRRAAGLPLAMAASFFLAFGLGWAARQADPFGRANPGASDQQLMSAASQDFASAPLDEDEPLLASNAIRWDTVTMVVDRGPDGAPRQIELPVVEGADVDASWLTSSEPLVPDELATALERLGHRVREQRQFVSWQLDDGRHVVVPVDEVEFLPIAATDAASAYEGYQ